MSKVQNISPLPDGKESPEQRAQRVASSFDDCCTRKIAEMKDDLQLVRADFKALKNGGKLAGCATWDAFCETKLHRTKRAVNMLLADKPTDKQPDREVSSHPKAATPDLDKGKAVVAAVHYLSQFEGQQFQARFEEFLRELRAQFADQLQEVA